MRVSWLSRNGRRSWLSRRLRRPLRQVAAGSGMLALTVPLAWQSGVGVQHVDLPSAASARAGVVRLADWVTDRGTPPPKVPAQQAGTAAGQKHLVPFTQTRSVKHAAGRAPGAGKGQSPSWAAHKPGGAASTAFKAPGPVLGFNAATSTPVTSATTATAQLYKNADGSFTRKVWPGPVNYQTASGSWAPIDETLAPGAGGRWQEKANSVDASFAAAAGDSSLAAAGNADGSQQVSFSLAGSGNVAGTATGASVTYPGALPGTDVTETATADGISESLTLSSASAGASWVFPLTLKGLTASLAGGSVVLTDSAGRVTGVIPPAVARSGPGNPAVPGAQASSQLTYQLVTRNGAPALQMTLDPAWLNAPGRVFPVTVDPTVYLGPQANTYAESQNGTAQTGNNSGTYFLPSGTVTDSGTTYKDIDFLNFSGLGSSLSGDYITSASLNLFASQAIQCTTAEEVYAYQVTGSWSPTAAMTYPGPAYGTKDAQWTGTAPSRACSNGSGQLGQGGWISLAFNSAGLSLLNDWTSGTAIPNYGFAVAPSLTDQQQFQVFDSFADSNVSASQGGDCTGYCNPSLQVTYSTGAPPEVTSQYPPNNYNVPVLTPELIASAQDAQGLALHYQFTVYNSAGSQVASSGSLSSGDWTVPAGVLAWGQTYAWTVQATDSVGSSPSPQANYFSTPVPQPLVTSELSQNAAGAGFDPRTGNWTTSATDAQVSTVGPALEVTRDYNSQNPQLSGAFGAGWSSVLDMRVAPGPGSTATQVVSYPDGQQVAFGLNPGSSTYSPPPGRFATLAPASGGFTLTDKNDTVYRFTQALSSGGYGITSITDALGHAEAFAWNGTGQITTITSASGRKLALTWGWPSGADYPHVSSVLTGDATPGSASTAQNWAYRYSGDDLSAACPPASATACTAYTYTPGSDYPGAVLDSGPHAYWRLDDRAGSGMAADSVLANEGADNAPYSAVTLGQDQGPLAGSTATAATFNGSSSYVTLQQGLASGAANQTVSLWFKTSSPDGVLFSYENAPLSAGSTTAGWVPAIYIGSDGKLNAKYYNGNVTTMTSAAPVDDGRWHLVTLTAGGNTQALCLDGNQIGSQSGAVQIAGQANNYIGAGYNGVGWPDEKYYGSSAAYPEYFHGDISDVAFWGRQLTNAEALTLYADGTTPAALLTRLTRPSGSVYAQLGYDPLTGRVTSDTDSNGGTWQLHPPTAGGSSQLYAASVLAAAPASYWRLNDTGATQAADTVSCDCGPHDQPATYYGVTEGVAGAGPFTDQPAAQFTGTGSYLSLPATAATTGGPGTVGVWFKTTGTDQVLYSEESGPVTGSVPSAYDPVLYVGADGKLNGGFLDSAYTDATSSAAVNDGNWHYAVLAAGTGSQSLYVDGALQGTVNATLNASPAWTNAAAGAGFIDGNWPDTGASSPQAEWLTGNLAELAWYPAQLTAAQVSAQWQAAQNSSGLTPVQSSTVTDPGNHVLTWTYDLLNSGRELSETNAEGAVTSYGYDTRGFQDETDVGGISETQTGYDTRGNKVSETTCQDQAANLCSTSYWTYYPNDTAEQLSPDPRNDLMLTYADGRSASAADTTYQTRYSYDPTGKVTSVTSPPVTGYPSGRATTYAYTDGTTSAGGYQGAVPPEGLPYQETTPGGAVTTTLYYADGNEAQVTDPDGQRTLYTYDGLGRQVSEKVSSDTYPGGLTTSYAYDANGNLATQADPAVTNRVTGAVHTAQTATSYDPDDNVLSRTVTDQTGQDAARTATRAYNAYDQLVTETDPAGSKTTYSYDAYGNKASQTDPGGNLTQYAYDGDGHLLTTTLANYTGSPPGSQAAAPLVEESRTYDPAGRLARATDAMGRQTDYLYLDNDLLAQETQHTADWSSSFVDDYYGYDGAGNVNEEWAGNGETYTTTAFDAAGRMTQQVTDPSGLDRSTSVSYTPDDQRASVTQSGAGSASQTTSYTYDPAGNVLSQNLTDPGAGGPAAWYRLSQASGTAVPDVVSGGQPATASGVTWNGSYGTFSGGPGSRMTTAGPVVDTTGSFSVSAWVNLAAITGSDEQVLSQDAGSMSGFYLGINGGTSNWGFARPEEDQNTPPNWAISNGPTAHTGTWTFLTGVFDANTGAVQLYVNGTASASATDSSPVAAKGPLEIGAEKRDSQAGTGNFDGSIANVEVYPSALSAAEVGNLYQQHQNGGDIVRGGLTTTWTRDQRGLPTSMTNPDRELTSYTYDEAGQLAVTTGPPVTAQTYGNPVVTARPVTTTGYDTFGDEVEDRDPDGNLTTYAYDADGQPVSKTLPPYTPPGGSPVTAVDTTAYDANGRVISVSDGLNNTTRYGYDQLGDNVTVTAPDNSVTATAYDAAGEPLSVTSPTGAVTDSTYDYLGRRATLTQVERHARSGTAVYTTTYAYGDAGGSTGGGGQLARENSPDGVSTSYAYDPSGAVTSVTDGARNTTSYSYDALGRKTKVTYPDGTASATGYDAAGNVTSTANLSASGTTLASTAAAFNGEGGQVSATDPAGNPTAFTYDPTGLVTAEVQPVSATSAVSTSFGYDLAGNQTLYTDGNGNPWWDTYNSWGLQESRVEPSTAAYSGTANSAFTMAYDAAGRAVTETEPGGATVTSTYNNLSELTGQSATGADAATPTRTFGYDAAGNVTSAATSSTASSGSNATSESFTYNDRGQVLTAAGSGGSTSYAYNGDGQATSVADAAGTTTYAYDSAGRLATLADPATGTTATYSYNPDSQVSQVSYGSGSDTRSFGYDTQRRLASDTLKTSAGSTLASVSYGYNADSEITSQATTGLAGPASNTYTYDEAGRLTSWNNGTATTAYGYDPNGNLTQDGSKTYTYDARDEMTSDGTSSYGYTARGTPSSESGLSGTVAVTFDAYGDQATAGTRSYAYDALGRLNSDTPAAGGGGYQFSYAGSTGTIASDGASAYTWDPSGTSLIGVGTPGGGTSGVLALANAHGDVLGQFTASGTGVSGSQAYDPWGKVTTTTGTQQGMLGYQSAWSDPASGKDLMGARWYAPSAGDFTSADTVQVNPDPDPAAGNPFAYASDEPLDLTDPSGHGCGWTNPLGCVKAAVNKVKSSPVVKKAVAVVKAVVKKAAPVVKVARAALRTVKNIAVKVADGARTVARVTVRVVTHPVAAAKAVVRAVKAMPIVKKAVSALKTAGKALKAAGAAVTKAAASAGRFVKAHAAAIGGAVAGVAVFAGCEAVTAGAGSLGCAALSGAAASAVSYGITAAQTGKFSWSGLGKAALTGAVSGLAGGALGELAGAAAGSFAGDASSALDSLSGEAGDSGSVADSAAGEARAPAGEEPAAPSCGGQSFTAGTLVLLAGGKTVPISQLKTGDTVLAGDTRTGKDQPETVTAVLVHHDTDLYDLTVKTGHGTEVIHTTSGHLFWDPYPHYGWIPAKQLKPGMHLKTPDGQPAVVVGGSVPAVHDGWMWDLTVPGNNDHDFYVAVGTAADILVHNVSCPTADGGKYGQLRPAGAGNQINHMPQDAATPLTRYSGPAIRMAQEDHQAVWSTGSSIQSQAWREMQTGLVDSGQIDGAMMNDINDVTTRFPGDYNNAIGEMIGSLPGNAGYQALRTVPSEVSVQLTLW